MVPSKEEEVAANRREDKYEYKWEIHNWMKVQKRKKLLETQRRLVDTGHTKWEIGLMAYPTKTNQISFYWKFIPGDQTKKELRYAIEVQLCFKSSGSQPNTLFERSGIIKVNDVSTVQVVTSKLHYKMSDHYWSERVDTNGAIGFLVNLTFMIPITTASTSPPNSKLEQLSTRFFTTNKRNMTAALNDSTLSDLRIVTSDKKELTASSFILKVQCPVFASMFSSQFAESLTGVVNVEDISGKTMEILLHFFYTGDLLSTWCDADTIIEFTYAAGKYQLTDILEMLDSVLGTTDKQETSEFDMALMSLANKLELKNAEARLLERAKKINCNLARAEECLALFDNVGIDDCGDCDGGE